MDKNNYQTIPFSTPVLDFPLESGSILSNREIKAKKHDLHLGAYDHAEPVAQPVILNSIKLDNTNSLEVVFISN